jgi:O-acetyl-ADP-ribose deacetylase
MSIQDNFLDLLHVKKGDITKEQADAIVNAANPSLLGGGGVDGAIHRAAGPGLLEECRKLGGCAHGEARITKAYNLPAKFIIHTPGPIYHGGNNGESAILRNSYYNSLSLARDNKCKSIAFPSISTGIYGYPKDEACSIAIMTALEFMQKNNYNINVYYVVFDDENYQYYRNKLESLG